VSETNIIIERKQHLQYENILSDCVDCI